MIRLLTVILSFFVGRYNAVARGSAMPIMELAMSQGRKIAFLLCSALICSLLMVGGFFVALVEGSFAYEAEGVLYPTTLFISGLVLLFGSIGAMAFIFSKRNWGIIDTPTFASEPKKTSHPIEDAVLMLINDFIKERESTRQARAERAASYTATPRAGEYDSPPRAPQPTAEAFYQ